MASNTIILRPVSCEKDASGAYDVSPESAGLTDVTAVNEVVADDSGGYVTVTALGSGSARSRYYTLGTQSDIPSAVIGGRLYVRYNLYTNHTIRAQVGLGRDFSLDVDEEEASLPATTNATMTTVWTTHVRELPSELITAINNSLSNGTFPSNITIYLYMYTSSKASGLGVTQIYLELDYVTDIGIHKKVNGEWKAATAAYKKVSGAWTEISADECKAYLANAPIVTK